MLNYKWEREATIYLSIQFLHSLRDECSHLYPWDFALSMDVISMRLTHNFHDDTPKKTKADYSVPSPTHHNLTWSWCLSGFLQLVMQMCEVYTRYVLCVWHQFHVPGMACVSDTNFMYHVCSVCVAPIFCTRYGQCAWHQLHVPSTVSVHDTNFMYQVWLACKTPTSCTRYGWHVRHQFHVPGMVGV